MPRSKKPPGGSCDFQIKQFDKEIYVNSDEEELCCPDEGVYSTAHTHLEFPPEPLNFQLDPAHFKVFPSPSYIYPPRLPLPIATECLGKAPDGFYPPPDNLFCHAGFIFAEPVINYIMVSAWLASSQLGPHDRPEIYHSCLVGNDTRTRTNTRYVLHSCGNPCCCDRTHNLMIAAARCSLLRRLRMRIIITIGLGRSRSSITLFPDKELLRDPMSHPIWFMVPQLDTDHLGIEIHRKCSPADYLAQLGLRRKPNICKNEIKRKSFEAWIAKLKANSEYPDCPNPSITLSCVQTFLCKDLEVPSHRVFPTIGTKKILEKPAHDYDNELNDWTWKLNDEVTLRKCGLWTPGKSITDTFSSPDFQSNAYMDYLRSSFHTLSTDGYLSSVRKCNLLKKGLQCPTVGAKKQRLNEFNEKKRSLALSVVRPDSMCSLKKSSQSARQISDKKNKRKPKHRDTKKPKTLLRSLLTLPIETNSQDNHDASSRVFTEDDLRACNSLTSGRVETCQQVSLTKVTDAPREFLTSVPKISLTRMSELSAKTSSVVNREKTQAVTVASSEHSTLQFLKQPRHSQRQVRLTKRFQ